MRRRSEIGNKQIKANNRPNPYDVDDIINKAAAIEEREKFEEQFKKSIVQGIEHGLKEGNEE